MRTRPKVRPKQDSFRAEQHNAGPSKDSVPNREMIGNMMRATKTRGNLRDYVLISGYRLIDRSGAYDIRTENGQTIGMLGMSQEVALVHKRQLHRLVGEQYAALFWRRRLGMRAGADTPRRWVAKHGKLPAAMPEIAVRATGEERDDGETDAVSKAVPAEPGLDGPGRAGEVQANAGDRPD